MYVTTDDIRAAIVADVRNDAADQFLSAQLAVAANLDPRFPKNSIVSDSLSESIRTEDGLNELIDKLDKGYRVMVVALGVPGSSDYPKEIHRLLEAWKKARRKPVLLLVSNHPKATQDLVSSWSGWQQMPHFLRQAVQVNDEYLILSSKKALEALHDSMHTARRLEAELNQSRGDIRPSSVVAEPEITDHRKMEFTLKA